MIFFPNNRMTKFRQIRREIRSAMTRKSDPFRPFFSGVTFSRAICHSKPPRETAKKLFFCTINPSILV